MIEIERLVFVCQNLEQTFSDPLWENFCVSPIRKIRPFLKSRYVLFKNVMLEMLEVVDHEDAKDFVFFEEWKWSSQPTWVGTGCRVSNLEKAIIECKLYNIHSLEEFSQKNSAYQKGFKHRSCLLTKKWHSRLLYLTEYDNCFFVERLNAICTEPLKKEAFHINIHITSLNDLMDESINLIDKKRDTVKLTLFPESSQKRSYDFGWIIFDG